MPRFDDDRDERDDLDEREDEYDRAGPPRSAAWGSA